VRRRCGGCPAQVTSLEARTSMRVAPAVDRPRTGECPRTIVWPTPYLPLCGATFAHRAVPRASPDPLAAWQENQDEQRSGTDIAPLCNRTPLSNLFRCIQFTHKAQEDRCSKDDASRAVLERLRPSRGLLLVSVWAGAGDPGKRRRPPSMSLGPPRGTLRSLIHCSGSATGAQRARKCPVYKRRIAQCKVSACSYVRWV